jgi:hypothetical protein
MRRHDRAYWKDKAAKLLKSQRGVLNVNIGQGPAKSPEVMPVVGVTDGVYMGIMTRDFGTVYRDPGADQAMKKYGLDPDHACPMEQLRFRRPAMYKAITDSSTAVLATGESVLNFLTEYTPLPEAYLLKMAPLDEDRVMWVSINVMMLASTSVTHWGAQVEEFLVQNSFSLDVN